MNLREIELHQRIERRDAYIVKQELEIEKLKELIRVTASELGFMIDSANTAIKSKITSSTIDEPEYFDAETVHNAMKYIN